MIRFLVLRAAFGGGLFLLACVGGFFYETRKACNSIKKETILSLNFPGLRQIFKRLRVLPVSINTQFIEGI